MGYFFFGRGWAKLTLIVAQASSSFSTQFHDLLMEEDYLVIVWYLLSQFVVRLFPLRTGEV
jgi:hypothetical protein